MPQRRTNEARAPAHRQPEDPVIFTIFGILKDSNAHRALQLVLIAALYSPISWLCLTPVYGSVPSSIYHSQGKAAAAMGGFLLRRHLKRLLPAESLKWLPAFAFWIPTIHFIMFKYSSLLGASFGPLLTELATYYPLVFFSLFAAGIHLDHINFSGFGDTLAPLAPIVLTILAFVTGESFGGGFLMRKIGANLILSRLGLQLLTAGMLALAIPGSILWPALPSLAFNVIHNLHNPMQRTTSVLNATLAVHNFSLIDRQESITGYISVLDNVAAGYRVMRCDHSLLGGEWKIPAERDSRTAEVHEPIYGIFAMLEAVRLAETEDGQPRRPDCESTALNIGLGIGTAPGALIAHGINTTIVELDPVVYKFARKYFNLPEKHMPIISDAVHLVTDAQARNIATRYDYIIHDVFTGGAEPVELFTYEFLSGLDFLLKEDGVVAINYAGDLSLPASSYVIRTILSVFPICRIFREALPEAGSQTDFTNMVVFCKHSSRRSPLTFRRPALSDYLGSGVRQKFLYPHPELEIRKDAFNLDGQGQILRRGQTRQLERWHQRSAIGHWNIMRTVLPDAIWENW